MSELSGHSGVLGHWVSFDLCVLSFANSSGERHLLGFEVGSWVISLSDSCQGGSEALDSLCVHLMRG